MNENMGCPITRKDVRSRMMGMYNDLQSTGTIDTLEKIIYQDEEGVILSRDELHTATFETIRKEVQHWLENEFGPNAYLLGYTTSDVVLMLLSFHEGERHG